MKKALIIISILLLIGVIVVIMLFNNKDQEDNHIESDVYGYLVYHKNDNYILVELHSNSANKEIVKSEYMLNNLTYKHGELYYYYQDRNDSTTHFMVYKDDEPKELKVEKNGYSSIFDSTDNFLFTSSYDKEIIRTDLKTGKEETITSYPTRNLFVYNSRLYVQASDAYYSFNINGKNERKIDESEYKQALDKVGYKEIEYLYYNQYYIYNGKYIFLRNEQTTITYDDKEIYKTTGFRRFINLYYTDEEGKIAFIDYFGSSSLENPKYYKYDLNNNKLEEVTAEDIYEANYIFIK